MKLYGITGCDTVKKARAWLEAHGRDYAFHDYKKNGVDEAKLHTFAGQFGWDEVLNRRGLTWRRLSEEEKAGITDLNSAIALMSAKPSAIRRPILEHSGGVLLGFKADAWEETLL